jgi:electron transport complex protein RnfC
MYRYVNAGKVDQLQRLHVLDCMECGCCSFTCPGKLPLVEKFRIGKKMVREVQSK